MPPKAAVRSPMCISACPVRSSKRTSCTAELTGTLVLSSASAGMPALSCGIGAALDCPGRSGIVPDEDFAKTGPVAVSTMVGPAGGGAMETEGVVVVVFACRSLAFSSLRHFCDELAALVVFLDTSLGAGAETFSDFRDTGGEASLLSAGWLLGPATLGPVTLEATAFNFCKTGVVSPCIAAPSVCSAEM